MMLQMQISTAVKKNGPEAPLWSKACLRKFSRGNTSEKEDHIVCVVQYSKDTHQRLAGLL